MDSVKLLVGGSGGGGGGFGEAASARAMGIDSDGCLPSLTLKQRLTGCVICFGAGMLVSMCSTLSITNPVHFGILYTVGNALSLCSTTLLFGPMRQIRNMFHRKRVVATLMYLAALVGTLAVALETGNVWLTLLMILVQFCCLVWYTLSYIPYARDMVRRMLLGCIGRK